MNRSTLKTNLIATAMLLILLGADQAIKLWAINNLADVGSITVIHRFFSLTYVENRGAAFGILQGNTVLLSIITGAVMLAGLFLVYSGRLKGSGCTYTSMLIISGGLGNLLDRLIRGFVVDYLDFSALFGFPVFNLADCCVVIGCILLLIQIMRSDLGNEKSDSTAPNSGDNVSSGES